MDIVYREAESADADSLLVHLKSVGAETDNLSFGADTFNISPEKEAKFIEKFKHNKNDIMFVALDGDLIVGNASVFRNRVARYSHRAELSITVLKEYWGQGIGKMLMKMLIDFAEKTNCKVVHLEVRSDNIRAISLYKSFGFEKIGVYHKFFKINDEYFDADLMNFYL